MKVERAYPPNFPAILEKFPEAKDKGVIFTYGDTIYNPWGGLIPDWIVAHEEVHSTRQGLSKEEVEAWWDRYLADEQFRFEEELLAHKVEYKTFCEKVKDRERRSRQLHRIAMRLAGPLYGRMIPYMSAKRVVAND